MRNKRVDIDGSKVQCVGGIQSTMARAQSQIRSKVITRIQVRSDGGMQ